MVGRSEDVPWTFECLVGVFYIESPYYMFSIGPVFHTIVITIIMAVPKTLKTPGFV